MARPKKIETKEEARSRLTACWCVKIAMLVTMQERNSTGGMSCDSAAS